MNDENKITEELLDQILFGRFTEDEVAASLPVNERDNFPHEVVLHQSAAVVIRRHSIIQQVKSVEDAFFKDQAEKKKEIEEVYSFTGRKFFRIFIAIAAVFIVTASVIVLYWYNGNTGDKLFNERYQPYHVNVARSDNNENDTASFVRDKMVTASAYMETKRYHEAAILFNDIISNNLLTGNRLYHDDAEYYLALAYIKQKQYDKASQLLDKIHTDREHTFNGEVNWWFLTRVKWLK